MRFKIAIIAAMALVLTVLLQGAASGMNSAEGATVVADATVHDAPPLALGVGIGTQVRVPAYLFQCPSVQCNRGNASPGDDVATICWLPLDDNYRWNWVFNHANGHTGFVSTEHLTVGAPASCDSIGIGTQVRVPAYLFQCPSVLCNRGDAAPGNDVATVCHAPLDDVYDWNLVLNHVNGHVGFVSTEHLTRHSSVAC